MPVAGASLCEWKGVGRYFDVTGGERVAARAAWAYPGPKSHPRLAHNPAVDGRTREPPVGRTQIQSSKGACSTSSPSRTAQNDSPTSWP